MAKPVTSVLFSAAGKGDFPTDMLRHEKCWPADTLSALAMMKPTITSDGKELSRTIVLRLDSVWGDLSGPSVARWVRHGWSVSIISAERSGQDVTQDVRRECALAYTEDTQGRPL